MRDKLTADERELWDFCPQPRRQLHSGVFYHAASLTVVLENNSFVNGNLQMSAGSLTVSNSSVGHDLQISGASSFSIGPAVNITGNLQVQNLPAGTGTNQVCGARNPPPVQCEAGTMPANHRIRLHQDQRLSPPGPQATQHNPEKSVAMGESWLRTASS